MRSDAEPVTKVAARVTTETTLTGCAAFVALASVALQGAGLQPVATVTIVLATWFLVLARRIDLTLAAAAVALGWPAVVFVVLSITPVLRWNPGLTSSVVLALSLVGAVALSHRRSATRSLRRNVPIVLAALSGGLLWLGGLVMGFVRPRGAGLSWAMYRDSTMDLWEAGRILEYHGIGSLGAMPTIQPLAHGLTASLVLPLSDYSASPQSARALLEGHAYHWSVTIVLASLLAGLCAWRIAGSMRVAGGRSWLALGAAVAASLSLTLEPVLGTVVDFGQINATLIVVILLASAVAALGARAHLSLALSLLLTAMGLLAATWLPFICVPLALSIPVIVRLRRSGLSRDRVLPWMLPGLAICGWALAVFGGATLRTAIAGAPGSGESLATVETFSRAGYWESYTNPVWPPLTAVFIVTIAVAVIGLRNTARWRSTVLGMTLAGLAVGFAPFLIALGGWPQQFAYYPAKYLFVATAFMIPVALGAIARLARDRGASRATAVALCTLVGVVLANSPLFAARALVPTSVLLASEERFGAHTDVAGRFTEFASSEQLVLPWRLDPSSDTTINLMMSAIGPDEDLAVRNLSRAVLRTYRNDFRAGVACLLAAAETRPVVLTTADETLEEKIIASCPEASIEVRLVSLH